MDTTPARFGPFQVIRRLGDGRLGQVHLGRSDGGALAVIELLPTDGRRHAIADEIAALRAVHASWTASVLAADPTATLPWVATEYVPGRSLHEAVSRSGPLPEAAVRILAGRFAEALTALHGAGLVHREITPASVLLGPDGPRLAFFGVPAPVPGYRAPEQLRGEPVGPAADIFSLGGVLTFAATGHGPFETDRRIWTILDGAPNLAAVAEPLRPLLRDCLSATAAARPTAADLAGGLALTSGRAFTPRTVAATPPTPGVPPRFAPPCPPPADPAPSRRTGKKPLAVAACVTSALVVIGLVAVSGRIVDSLTATGRAVPHYATVSDLSAAIERKVGTEHTVRVRDVTVVENAPSAPPEAIGMWSETDTELQLDAGRTASRSVMRDHSPGLSDSATTFVSVDGHTWIRDSTDQAWTPIASDVALGGSREAIRDLVDPVLPVARMGDAVSIVESAEELVDGVRARRYTLRVDVARALGREIDDLQVWLDADDHPLRTLAVAHPTDTSTVRGETTYRGWGDPVEITPPPADQIAH
ncbi:serine/threonine-protein kinase [Pseudonocardia spinosispora]|uniref:serine/threonine-protein kinase n=1 Tax=Pseudonocardia spinosispora TaxID=103441 RepID=UPI00041FF0E0|nr:hypothetical protein [Pseudonocardia spinosispora]